MQLDIGVEWNASQYKIAFSPLLSVFDYQRDAKKDFKDRCLNH